MQSARIAGNSDALAGVFIVHSSMSRGDHVMRQGFLLVLALYDVLGIASVAAQTPPTRVRCEVEQLSGNVLKVKTREGPSRDITLAPNFAVTGVTTAELSSIAANSFVGVAAVPQPDGMLRALEVLDLSQIRARQRGGPLSLGPDAGEHDDERDGRRPGQPAERPGHDVAL